MTLTREAELDGEQLVRYLLEDEEIMTTLTTRVKAIMRSYPCHYCGVAAGERCRSSSGTETSFEHSDRYRQAVDAGELPIDVTAYYS